ncbi:EAL domain-containing protein [uncultured Thiodictyon sp.]|jgi:diguanylate cyclase (GGDEF)-like protein/PAS domain S-box-containing protein|uniref:EAL domain-containing protein n=1 Tax=uncultured Thiodictyon sp. TaxID=1846217 RepID=UPI0025D7E30F|nr:EAL domain-containing protein [uncultured Thiodictyon sp.]
MNNHRDQDHQDDQDYLRALSVLYVEDEDEIRDELAVYLRRRVARVYTAADGQAGLDAFTNHQPDLVITDIRMPVMNGLEMAERIRAVNAKVPIIIMTAFEETSYFQKAIELGVDRYLTKPLNLDLLSSALLKCARVIRAEAALREVQQRYRLLFALSHIAISVTDAADERPGLLIADGHVVDCNAAFLSLLGFADRNELTGLLFSDLLMPDTLDRVNQLIRDELLVRGFSPESEVELRHKDGRAVPVIVQLILRRDAAGRATETWAVMRDVSEPRRAEQALRLAARVFESSGEGILISDEENRILSVNPAFSKITGYSQEEVIGQNPRLLKSDWQGPDFYDRLWRSLHTTGHWQGEIWNRRKSGEVYAEWLSITVVRNAQGQVLNYIAIFSDVSEIRAATQHIEFLTHYDPLTRLANRRLLEERVGDLISLAARTQTGLALMFIDLDRFKVINDSLGHAAGDAILETAAQRMHAAVREVDILARLGGDEFVCVLPGIAQADDATIVARRLMLLIDEPMQVAGQSLTVTSSIGISLYPADGSDYETLLKHADAAMYAAKRAGRDNFMFFSQDMNGDIGRQMRKMRMENALRGALKAGEFQLHYQPQVAIGSGRIIGLEALLRWNCAELGAVAPGLFIPLAEETGLIIAIGEWVLREACRQNAQWQREGLPAVLVAVNLSAVQFRQKGLPDTVRSALQDSGLAPQWLELELTESVVMQDAQYAIASLSLLKQIGTSLVIDDFGTGYSSLAYLKRFSIDKLKIDQSFVRDLSGSGDDEKIVTAIIGLAHALGLKVIAEGVETAEQLGFLREQKCDEMQGYLYSRPIPAAAVAELLRGASLPGG